MPLSLETRPRRGAYPRAIGLIVLAGLVAVATTGCGLTVKQRTAALSFGAATQDLAAVAADEFSTSRHEVIEMNKVRNQLVDPARRVAPLEGSLTLERAKIRVDAVSALKTYGELLTTLVTSSQREELKKAADSFVASLNKVDSVTLSAEEGSAISAGVVAIGGLFVEAERKKSVKSIVEMAHAHVIAVASQVIRDFDPNDQAWSLAYNVVADDLRAASAGAPSDSADKAMRAGARDTAELNTERFSRTSELILDACEKLIDAEDELYDVLKADVIGLDDIELYIQQVDEMVAIYRLLED